MTAPDPQTEVRREARYFVRNDDALIVSIEGHGEEGEPAATGRVIDISASGAKLSLPVKLEKGEISQIHLEAKECRIQLRLEGKCCWVAPAGGQSWKVGVAFTKKVPGKTLNRLSRKGVLERRNDIRYEVDLKADARWELGGVDAAPVRLLDLSAGGFRLFTGEPRDVGSRVRLEAVDLEGEPVTVHGIALWRETTEGGYFVGCRYLTKDGYRQLRRLMEPEEAPPEEPQGRLQQWQAKWNELVAAMVDYGWDVWESRLVRELREYSLRGWESRPGQALRKTCRKTWESRPVQGMLAYGRQGWESRPVQGLLERGRKVCAWRPKQSPIEWCSRLLEKTRWSSRSDGQG